MIPEGAKIKFIDVLFYPGDFVSAFKFFDVHGLLIWKIGHVDDSELEVQRVELEDDEVILGFVAKLAA